MGKNNVMSPQMTQRIRESFDKQSLMQTFGASVATVAQGHVVLRAPILPLARQQQGFGHAGLSFALGDTAAGYAALTVMPEDCEVVTAEIKINLLAPAIGQELIATGKVIKPGRRLVVVTAEVVARNDGDDTVIAVLQGTMVPVPKS